MPNWSRFIFSFFILKQSESIKSNVLDTQLQSQDMLSAVFHGPSLLPPNPERQYAPGARRKNVSSQFITYYLVNVHVRHEELHTAACRSANRQVLSRIKRFGRGDFQRQIEADRHVA